MLRTPVDTGLSQPQKLQNRLPHRQYLDRDRVHHVPSIDVSGAEKRRIYDEWTSAGKPHNIICSQCRNPHSLIPCETCCRSYHAACLQGIGGLSGRAEPFYCPTCKRNQWDQSLQFETPLPSSNVSGSSTPSANGSRVTSPSGFVDRRPLETPGPAIYSQTFASYAPTARSDLLSQAKGFLMINGQFPTDQEFPPELLSKLATMMAAAESQKSLQDEIQTLKEENANLRNENANMRDYFNAKLPTREPMFTTQPSDVQPDTPKPATDTGEKAWDQIMIDMI